MHKNTYRTLKLRLIFTRFGDSLFLFHPENWNLRQISLKKLQILGNDMKNFVTIAFVLLATGTSAFAGSGSLNGIKTFNVNGRVHSLSAMLTPYLWVRKTRNSFVNMRMVKLTMVPTIQSSLAKLSTDPVAACLPWSNSVTCPTMSVDTLERLMQAEMWLAQRLM